MMIKLQSILIVIFISGSCACNAQVDWVKYVGSPVFALGPSGSWDSHNVMSPSVLQFSGQFWMYYVGVRGPFFRFGQPVAVLRKDYAFPFSSPTRGQILYCSSSGSFFDGSAAKIMLSGIDCELFLVTVYATFQQNGYQNMDLQS